MWSDLLLLYSFITIQFEGKGITNLTFPTGKVKCYTAGAFGDNKVVIVGAKNNGATEQTLLLLEL